MAAKIKELRKRRGLSQERVAEDIGLSVGYYSRLESGKRPISSKWLQKIADYFNVQVAELFVGNTPFELVSKGTQPVKVMGAVEAGAWREALEWPVADQYYITVPILRSTAKSAFALEVRGSSMNREYPPGSILICVPILEYHDELKNGDHIICERRSPDGHIEATVKELQKDEAGKIWLWPRSTDPQHQQPIDLAWPPPNDGEYESEIAISAVVIGSYNPR